VPPGSVKEIFNVVSAGISKKSRSSTRAGPTNIHGCMASMTIDLLAIDLFDLILANPKFSQLDIQ
jgi:hypothetical protein